LFLLSGGAEDSLFWWSPSVSGCWGCLVHIQPFRLAEIWKVHGTQIQVDCVSVDFL
jgi:hypothetical protein